MKTDRNVKNVSPEFILRLGIGFAFVYAGANVLLYPDMWIGFVPRWIGAVMPIQTFLLVYSVFEMILGLAVFSGRSIAAISMVAFWNLMFVLIFYGIDQTTFAAFSVALASLALFFMSFKEKEVK